MPFIRRHRSPSPAVFVRTPSTSTSPRSSGTKLADPSRSVLFAQDPIASMSRELTPSETWPLYHFEMHARDCPSCRDPERVHRAQTQVCASGSALARKATAILYSRNAGADVFAFADAPSGRTRVELPRNYPMTRSLLRAVERSNAYPNAVPVLSRGDAASAGKAIAMPPPRPRAAGPPSAWTGSVASGSSAGSGGLDDEYAYAPRRSGSFRRSAPAVNVLGGSPPRASRWTRRSFSSSSSEPALDIPELTHSPSPSPSRRRSGSVRRRSRNSPPVSGEYGYDHGYDYGYEYEREREPRVEILAKGLASLAVRSQREDLSGATLVPGPPFGPTSTGTLESKRARRASFAGESRAEKQMGTTPVFATSVRLPPEKRGLQQQGRRRESMLL